MYDYVISEVLNKKLAKIVRKNYSQLAKIDKKVQQIIKDPTRFKKLRGDMKGSSRVHIDTHFVLIFEYDSKNKIVRFLDFDHHDNVY